MGEVMSTHGGCGASGHPWVEGMGRCWAPMGAGGVHGGGAGYL